VTREVAVKIRIQTPTVIGGIEGSINKCRSDQRHPLVSRPTPQEWQLTNCDGGGLCAQGREKSAAGLQMVSRRDGGMTRP
jgi:hypothetical protein